jgi:hypothetical protein
MPNALRVIALAAIILTLGFVAIAQIRWRHILGHVTAPAARILALATLGTAVVFLEAVWAFNLP